MIGTTMKKNQLEVLRKKWYKKLKEQGFEDIEDNQGRLSVYHNTFFSSRYNATVVESKTTYYRFAGIFLNIYKFNTATDRDWETNVL